MNAIGGFLVLSMGPLALLFLFVVGAFVVWLFVAREKTTRRKWLAGTLAAIVVILIPTWDEIAGRAYFRHLCESNGGIRIYERVKLGPEYRGIRFPDLPTEYERMKLASLYPYALESKEDLPGPARILYVRRMILDEQTGAVLGSLTNYFYGGGWLDNAVSLHGTGGGSCDRSEQDFRLLLERIFVIG